MAIREGKWRCPYCGSVNRGADLACPGCGAQRDKDVSFFLEDQAPEVTDEKLLARARAGADWLCAFCSTSNAPEAAACVQCGAERGTSPSRPEREVRPEPPPPPRAAAAPAGRGRSGCLVALVALLLLGLGFCGLAAWFSLRKSSDTVRVTGFAWERRLEVQALRTVRESAWRDQVPSGARVLSRRREQRATERVQTGTQRVKVGVRDKGNGFFEDVYEERPVYSERPVYGEKVTFEVERWTVVRNPEARGGDRRPRWPDPALQRGEKETGRQERYLARLQGRQRAYEMELPQARWEQLEEGRSYEAVVQGGSRVIELK